MSINKILTVDDSKVDLINIQNILSDAGYKVITANSGQTAIEKAVAEKPDLIFMDVVMQEMDGYQACRELTHQDATKNIPIIFVTAKGQKADRVWAEMTGAKGLVQKPYTPDQIIEQVNLLNQ
ncbi:MAG: response regulator [Thiomargarita sp.]|nr:response regulator [Thiomargarita sp.]